MKNRLAIFTYALMERTYERRDMFEWIQPKEEPPDQELEKLRQSIFEDLEGSDSWTDQFSQMMTMLERVYALRAKSRKPRAKPDTWIMAGAHVAGIVLIVLVENARPWTTRALEGGTFTKLFR